MFPSATGGRLRRSGLALPLPVPAVPAVLVALAALGPACASTPHLVPGPDLPRTPGPGTGATVSAAGVEVEARTNAWRWAPEDLEEVLTPVLLEITNESEHPLRIRYKELSIRAPSGGRLAALPPLDIEKTVTAPIGRYAYPTTGFRVAPYLHGYYSPYFGAYPGSFGYDPYYYDYFGPVFRSVALPTEAMLVRALPEGVVAPGGRAAGFVYFEELAEEPAADGTYVLHFELVDAGTGDAFGQVEIPFVRVQDGLQP